MLEMFNKIFHFILVVCGIIVMFFGNEILHMELTDLQKMTHGLLFFIWAEVLSVKAEML
jgi:cytochrome b subunit of formate dehydrogenase